MVMTPVPPTPPTTMPQALSAVRQRRLGQRRQRRQVALLLLLRLLQLPAFDRDEARAEALGAAVVQVAGALVDAPLAAELGFHRLDAQAVALHAAVAAAFAHRLVDDHALGGRDQLAALAAAALLGGAGLVVDDGGDAFHLAQLALDAVELVAVVHGDAGLQRRALVLLGLVGDDHHLLHALGDHALLDLHDAVAFGALAHLLAAGHRHRVVVEQLVGDVHAGGDGHADGQRAAVEVGAVAQVGEDVLVGGEGRLADPGHAFAAHLRVGAGAAVHPHRHVVAADAGGGARAFGHARAGVVRAAAAEPGNAVAGVGLQLGELALARRHDGQPRFHARDDVVADAQLLQPLGDGLGDDRRRQVGLGAQQPVLAGVGHAPFAAGAVALGLVELAQHVGAARRGASCRALPSAGIR